MTNKLISFHGEQEIKDFYINRLKQHYEMDEIVKGTYWENGKGCAVGCTVHSDSHDAYTTELGISWRLAMVEDSIFENLPNDQAKEFPLQFLNAIPVGIDTDLVFKKFIIWSISDEKDGLIKVLKNKDEIEILTKIAELYKESYTREIKFSEWESVSIEAIKLSVSAYASASYYAFSSSSVSASAYASAYASASSYAYAYAYSYAYASYSDSASAEWQGIKINRIILMRDKLIEFLKESV